MGLETSTVHLTDESKLYGILYTVTNVWYYRLFESADEAWRWHSDVAGPARKAYEAATDDSERELLEKAYDDIILPEPCGHPAEPALLTAYEHIRKGDHPIWPVRVCRVCRQIQDIRGILSDEVPRFEDMHKAEILGPLWLAVVERIDDTWTTNEKDDIAFAFRHAEGTGADAVLDYMLDNSYGKVADRFHRDVLPYLRTIERQPWLANRQA